MFLTLNRWKEVGIFFKTNSKTLKGFIGLLTGSGLLGFVSFNNSFKSLYGAIKEVEVDILTATAVCILLFILAAIFDEYRLRKVTPKKFKPTIREIEAIEYIQLTPSSYMIDVSEVAEVLELEKVIIRRMFLKFQVYGLLEKTTDINEKDGEFAYRVQDKLYMLEY